MKPLRTTLFVLALVILSSQTFRHVYVLWLEPRHSVLDKYNTDTENQITKAKSLDELLAHYDDAHKKAEAERAKEPKTEDEKLAIMNLEKEPYKGEARLKAAINDWEEKTKELYELWHFWLAGFIALFIGFYFTLKSDRWVGISFVILAFAEMIWATCPSFRAMGSSQPEFERLLIHKLILSIVSLCLLLGTWKMLHRPEPR